MDYLLYIIFNSYKFKYLIIDIIFYLSQKINFKIIIKNLYN